MNKYLLAAIAVTLLSTHTPAQSLPLSIITVAGIGAEGYHGDSAKATDCMMHWPEAVALDTAHNLYIADADNNVIRMVQNATGIITTFAGTGAENGTGLGGFAGDGGPATAAEFSYPSGVAIDKYGNVYIADQRNNRIRMINPAGTITTYAGNGTIGFGGDGGPATNASLYGPCRVAVDTFADLYIADSGNQRIRIVMYPSQTIYTLAGNGTKGNAGDDGLATAAELNDPIDMAVDVYGNVFIADYQNNEIRVAVPNAAWPTGDTIYTYAGTGTPGFSGDSAFAPDAYLYEPAGIAVDTGDNVYFSDLGNERIRMINPVTGNIVTIAGDGTSGYSGDGGLAIDAELWWPEGIAVDPQGELFVADKSNNRIREITSVLSTNNVAPPSSTIVVYPNPNTGEFSLHISSAYNEDVSIGISNVTGQTVATLSATTNNTVPINVSVPPGLYFLSASTAHGTLNEKVLVK